MNVFSAMFADASRYIHVEHGVVNWTSYLITQSRMEIARTHRIVFQKTKRASRPWSHHCSKVSGHGHGYDPNCDSSCLDYERKVLANASIGGLLK